MEVSPQSILELHFRLVSPHLSPENRRQLEEQLVELQKRPGYLVSGLRLCSSDIQGPARAANIPEDAIETIQQFTATQVRRALISTWLNTPESIAEAQRKEREGASSSSRKPRHHSEGLTHPEGLDVNLLSGSDSDDEDDDLAYVEDAIANARGINCDPRFRTVLIQEAEKREFRERIFQVFLNAPACCHRLLVDVVKALAASDYPTRWPSILGEIGRVLKSSKDLRVLGLALQCLLMLFKVFEYFKPEDQRRQALYRMIEAAFPTLHNLCVSLYEVNSVQAREVQRLIVRLFFSATNMSVPPFFLKKWENFVAWMDMLLRLVVLPLPAGEPTTPEKRGDWAPWKLRKWIFHIFNRVLGRYGKWQKGFPEEWQPFCPRFFKAFAPQMLKVCMGYLNQQRQRKPMPDRFVQVFLAFLDCAFRFQALYDLMKPHLPAILSQVFHPLLCFNAKDQEQWREDPQEYLRSQTNIMNEYYDPRKTAAAILQAVMKAKRRDLLQPFANHLMSCFKEFTSQKPTMALAGKFTGALLCLGLVHDQLIKTAPFNAGLEGIVRNVIVPAITSPIPFVRARAIWTFAQFSDVQFKNREILAIGLSKVLERLQDPELPVKVEAIMAIRAFAEFDVCRDALLKELPNVIKMVFTLFKHFDHDELVECLEILIVRFGKEITPYADGMCRRFVTEFHRLMATVEQNDNDMSAIAIDEIMRAVIALIAAVRKHNDLYVKMEAPIISMVKRVMTQDCIDFLEHAFKILSFYTYFPEQISPRIWEFYLPTVEIFNTWGSDFLEDIVPLLDNYITCGTEQFLQEGSPYLHKTMSLIEKCFKGKGNYSGYDPECGEAAKLVEVILQKCRGKVDKYVPGLINMTYLRLKSGGKNKGVNTLLLTVISNVFFYNPLLAITVLDKKQIGQEVMKGWITRANTLTRLYDKKLMVLGLSAILRLPFQKVPKEFQSFVPRIVGTALKVLESMNEQLRARDARKAEKRRKAEELRAAEQAEGDRSSDDEAGSGSESDDADGDNRTETEDLTLRQLEALREETKARLAEGMYGESSSSDDDAYFTDEDEEDDEDDKMVPNLVDETEELPFFMTSLRDFSNRYPEVYKRLMSGLSPELRELHQRFVQEMREREQNNQN